MFNVVANTVGSVVIRKGHSTGHSCFSALSFNHSVTRYYGKRERERALSLVSAADAKARDSKAAHKDKPQTKTGTEGEVAAAVV